MGYEMTNEMRSWRFHAFGTMRNLQLKRIPLPAPRRDECLVKVAYAGLNPADMFLVMGRYAGAGTPPFAVGRDGSGTVMEPDRAGRFKKGDRVVALRGDLGITREGTLADYVAAPASQLAPLPDGWTLEQGAANPLVLLTAWQALALAARVEAGRTVVITGASGGIGLASMILSKALGAKTIALSRDPVKRSRLVELGADHVLDFNGENIVQEIQDLGGADCVIENVAGPTLKRSLAFTNPYGNVCIIGALGGIRCEINPLDLIFKRVGVHGIQVSMYTDKELVPAWAEILRILAPTGATVPIDTIYPFPEVQKAFVHLRRGPIGKILVGPMGLDI